MVSNQYRYTGIVVVDICDPDRSFQYSNEKETNDAFVTYLNCRLQVLKSQGATIIEYNEDHSKHPLLTIEYDYTITNIEEYKEFLKSKTIKHLVYCGLHYPKCLVRSREMSMNRFDFDFINFSSVAIQLTRSTLADYTSPLEANLRHIQL